MSTIAPLFKADSLSIFVGIFIVFFSVLTIIYSIGSMRGRNGLFRYYLYIALTLVASLGAVFANELVLFIVFWGFLGLLLYLLIGFGQKKRAHATAKKAFIIIGGSDALMILGIAFVWHLAGTLDMDRLSIPLDNRIAVWAYVCLAVGAFAKAGVMPFHSWVPDMAEDAPTSIAAFLPASLDKLLGIYFLARISLDVFQMNSSMNTFLLITGSVTIVAAVMMALVQHDMKRLLGYHAVSQVGYMVLGIGTGNPIGIAGGLFHMLNNAIYKSCLFLSGGAVEKKAGTTDLDKLGGLAKITPIAFITFLIAAFAISGVPPFNGFTSKWMIYQGIIETAKGGSRLWVLWLIAAMFGSALTLASFMKLIHAVFLGQRSDKIKNLKSNLGKAGYWMRIPAVLLAALCVIFGIFAYAIPLKLFIFPSINFDVKLAGMWNPSLATAFILVGIGLGFLIYLLGLATKTREASVFIGGENLKDIPEMRVSGTAFYNTISDIGILGFIYKLAEKKLFDLYEVGTKITLFFNKSLRHIHNGILSTYLAWCLLGMIVIFYILFR